MTSEEESAVRAQVGAIENDGPGNPSARSRVPWGPILGTAVLLRALIAFGWLGHMPMVSDAASYDDLAAKLTTDFPGHEAFYWPPGNAFALAAAYAVFGRGIVVARVLLIVLNVATIGLGILLTRKLSRGNERAERASGWLSALYVPALLLVGQSYPQHLGALCLMAFAYFGLTAVREERISFYAIAGVAFGLGCLTRPSMVSVAPVVVVAWWVDARARRARGAGLGRAMGGLVLFFAVAIAIVAPVQAFNRAQGAGFTISTNNERNLFLGNNPYTPNYKTSQFGQRPLDELDPDVAAYLRSFYQRPHARDAMREEALSFMIGHPLITLYRTVNRSLAFWGFDYLSSRIIQKYEGWSTGRSLPLLGMEAGAFTLVMLLALTALFVCRPELDGYWTWGVATAVLAYEAPYAIAFSGGTYHFPVMPLVVALAAVPLGELGPKELARRVLASRPTLLAAAVFFLVQLQYAYWTFKMAD